MHRRSAGLVLSLLGLLFAGTGMYLMFMRPAMLPEDAAFSNIELGTLPPKLSAWLSIVFALIRDGDRGALRPCSDLAHRELAVDSIPGSLTSSARLAICSKPRYR